MSDYTAELAFLFTQVRKLSRPRSEVIAGPRSVKCGLDVVGFSHATIMRD